eukprot:4088205-Pyramimonas_sp.AAC.1
MKHGPQRASRRAGCAADGGHVAHGSAAPPPWIRVAAAELQAVLLVLPIAVAPLPARADCRPFLSAAAAGTARARSRQ